MCCADTAWQMQVVTANKPALFAQNLHMHMHMHAHPHAHTHTHMHTHMHAHTHLGRPARL